jgi:CrcB protein
LLGDLLAQKLSRHLHSRHRRCQPSLSLEPDRRPGIRPCVPYGTLFINVVGSFIVGFFIIWTTERVLIDPRWRLLVVIGFCGSFTTFSSYAFETMAYFEQGQWGLLAVNILSNNLLCLGAAFAGMALGRIS